MCAASRGKIPDYLGSMHIEFDILSALKGCWLSGERQWNSPSWRYYRALHSSVGFYLLFVLHFFTFRES